MEEMYPGGNPGSAYPPQYPLNYVIRKELLPHSVATLVFSIVSLSTMAVFGWIFAIIAMNNAKKALEISEQNPGKYSDVSLSMVKAGKTMSQLGLIFGLLGILIWILYFAFIFFMISQTSHYNHY